MICVIYDFSISAFWSGGSRPFMTFAVYVLFGGFRSVLRGNPDKSNSSYLHHHKARRPSGGAGRMSSPGMALNIEWRSPSAMYILTNIFIMHNAQQPHQSINTSHQSELRPKMTSRHYVPAMPAPCNGARPATVPPAVMPGIDTDMALFQAEVQRCGKIHLTLLRSVATHQAGGRQKPRRKIGEA